GVMTREARDLVLELQERRSSRPAAPPPASQAGTDEADKIGRMLAENRIVSETQVHMALELQRELRGKGIDRRLGDLLVVQGAIDRPTLETLLKTQSVRRKAPPHRRRRALFREELLPEHPLTLLMAGGIALLLSLGYVRVTGGATLVLEALLNSGSPP